MLMLQAVPYAQDEFVLLVPRGHELAQRSSIDKCELYNLSFVSMNKGSSVQAAQEETLLQQGIKWHKLYTYMVRLLLHSTGCPGTVRKAAHIPLKATVVYHPCTY